MLQDVTRLYTAAAAAAFPRPLPLLAPSEKCKMVLRPLLGGVPL